MDKDNTEKRLHEAEVQLASILRDAVESFTFNGVYGADGSLSLTVEFCNGKRQDLIVSIKTFIEFTKGKKLVVKGAEEKK